ncbi:uncharacterized protein UV8b_02504 [Ustilaginoidea virens]|uniref:Cytochrome P450 n=1 Tax=Ustilaginoidea virens TaxID=1159556 RepID=A0A8E5HN13_USTVR|nr:uncharacterized protein UV8b_02504 [Ustilaginoidea virens]QUC18263.1 hypothetical protein UV8b_02504 [Ustilaginoidea virens]
MSGYFLIGLAILAAYLYRLAYPWPYKGIPYNRRSARRLLGDIPDLIQFVKEGNDSDQFALEQCRKLNSPIVQLFFWPFCRPLIFVEDIQQVESIVCSRGGEFDRAPSTITAFRPFVPTSSILKLTTPEWRAQRRLWKDAMSGDFLRRVVARRMYHTSLELMHLLKTKAVIADGRPFPVMADFELATLDVIWSCFLGSELKGVLNETRGIERAAGETRQPEAKDEPAEIPAVSRLDVYRAIDYFNMTLEKTLSSPVPRWHHWLLRQMPMYRKHWAIKEEAINQLIEAARDGTSRSSEAGSERNEHVCALDVMFQRQRQQMLANGQKETAHLVPQTHEEIHDELLMFVITGHESTATTLSWSVKFLTNWPEEQAKLRDALRGALPSRNPSVEEILRSNVPYLDALLEECIRLANVVPRIVRVATVDTQLSGLPIPKGAQLMCRSQSAGWPGAAKDAHGGAALDEFWPDRWLDQAGNFNPAALPKLGFSAGPRACFGKAFAMQELRVMLTMLILRFRLEAVPEGLNSMQSRPRALRAPRCAYVRLTPL